MTGNPKELLKKGLEGLRRKDYDEAEYYLENATFFL